MFCSKCGKLVPDDAVFCSECGAPVSQQAPVQQTSYTQPVYNQPVFNQPAYSQPAYNQPVAAQKNSMLTKMPLMLTVAGIVVSLVASIITFIYLREYGITFGSFFGQTIIGLITTNVILALMAIFVMIGDSKPQSTKKIFGIIALIGGVLLVVIAVITFLAYLFTGNTYSGLLGFLSRFNALPVWVIIDDIRQFQYYSFFVDVVYLLTDFVMIILRGVAVLISVIWGIKAIRN